MLMDRNWIRTQSMFGQRMAQAFANNGDFVINAIEQMAGGSALADLRGRGFSVHDLHAIVTALRKQFSVRLFEATGGGGAVRLLTDGREIYARTATGDASGCRSSG